MGLFLFTRACTCVCMRVSVNMCMLELVRACEFPCMRACVCVHIPELPIENRAIFHMGIYSLCSCLRPSDGIQMY